MVEIYQKQKLCSDHRLLQSLLWMINFQFFWSPPVPFQQCQPYSYLIWNKQRKFAIIGILIIASIFMKTWKKASIWTRWAAWETNPLKCRTLQTLRLHGETGNSSLKIKWISLFHWAYVWDDAISILLVQWHRLIWNILCDRNFSHRVEFKTLFIGLSN